MFVEKILFVARRILWVVGLLVVLFQFARGERLPIKIYSSADGLAHNVVKRIVRDSRGYLWFCTREGLSRFDGYSFNSYGMEQGLPSAIVNDLLETREGVYWVATAGGLCRLNPLGNQHSNLAKAGPRDASNPMFTVYSPGADARSKLVLSLFQDREGGIYCGTGNGLYRMEAAGNEVRFSPVDLGIPDHFESRFIDCLMEDRVGALWVGSRGGLYRRCPDGRIETYTKDNGLPDTLIQSLLEDREGRIWVGTALGGLFRLVPDPSPNRNVVARVYTDEDGLPTRWINQLFQATDGVIWAGSSEGLIQFIPTDDGRDFRLRAYGRAHGFNSQEVAAIAEDRNGNMWVATPGSGVTKVARGGFTTFGKADGFFWSSTILQTTAGELVVSGGPSNEQVSISLFDGEKFNSLRIRCLENFYTWGWNQTVLEDRAGEWWIATVNGVYRFPKMIKSEQLARAQPKAVYTTRNGLAADVILRLFEDSRGDVWIGSGGHAKRSNGLSRWERRADAFHHYSEKDNLPRFDRFYVSSFAEDRSGNLWIGFSGDGGLVRSRDGSFTQFTSSDGLPSGQIRNMLVDMSGRLWLATTQGGLSRIDDPGAEHPTLLTYTTVNGLSSNEVTAVSEDKWGRIYIGTGRGMDRLDPTTDRIRHYTTADGLPVGQIESALLDRTGTLWFSSFVAGLVRLVPEPDPPPVAPPILITGLRVGGDPHLVSVLGEVEIAPIELSANKNQLQIDFVALGFSPGEGLLYQYMLEGADKVWSPLTEHRTVNFANLAPGRYRFVVRAANVEGVLSEKPASFGFTILPPIWQRWWFMASITALVGLIAYALHRYRMARLLELERVRTRIATDLHDDIGSSLSQIAIMSEVVRQQEGGENQRVSHPLSVIAGTSRELVDSMADIVWSINPKRDHLIDLTQRMRQFAGDLLAARNIEFTFAAPGLESDIRIETDVRREVFLIFKEAINNAVRHSACSSVEVRFVVNDRLMLTVTDDGQSFDPARAANGHGLASMKRRAQSIGGKLEILAKTGRSTTITLQAPLRRRSLRRLNIST